MRKILSLLLAAILILSFASCKKDIKKDKSQSSSDNSTSSVTSSVTSDNTSSNISSVETTSAASVSSKKVVSKQTKTSSVKKAAVPKASVTTSKLTNGNKTYSSVAEFIKNNQSALSELESQLSNDILTCKITDKNNYIRYEFTLVSVAKSDLSDSDIADLNENMEGLKSELSPFLNEAKQEIPSLKGFIYEIYDMYNVLISSYTM